MFVTNRFAKELGVLVWVAEPPTFHFFRSWVACVVNLNLKIPK